VAIRWSEQAVEDLSDIREYIARDSEHFASAVAGRIVRAVDRLREFPESGRVVPELGDPTIREVIHGVFRIVYVKREATVEILTVFRASRAFPDLGEE
jgi:toxin ParE1/3/4